jgi:hypothetical protein
MMKITRDHSVLTDTGGFNWLILSESGKPQMFAFASRKSWGICCDQTYEVDHFPLHSSFHELHAREKLSDRIATYLQCNRIEDDGAWLLDLDGDDWFTRSVSLHTIVRRSYSYGAGMLRHRFIVSLDEASKKKIIRYLPEGIMQRRK